MGDELNLGIRLIALPVVNSRFRDANLLRNLLLKQSPVESPLPKENPRLMKII